MLTGKLPFLGESPISVALKHLQETFEEPRVINPYIPQSVENIILRAMRKNPNERYASANEMLGDLETCLKAERLKEPKAIFNSDIPDFDETRVMPAIRGSIADTLAAPAGVNRMEKTTTVDSDTGSNRWDSRGLDEPRKRKWIKPVVTVATTLMIIALIYWGAQTVLGWFDIEEVDVPYVVNQTEADARVMLEKAGLKVEEPTVYTNKEGVAKDIVYEQSKPNQRVKVGSFIKLFVSTGPKMEAAADYTGKPYDDTVASLVTLGVSETRIDKKDEFSDEAPGTILTQTPAAGEQFDPKTVNFSFTVSQGKETFPMPKLLDMKEDEAIALLNSKGLKINKTDIVREPSYKDEGTVIGQYPYEPDAKVSKDAEITLTVSSGLPKDALEYTFNIVISPAEAGKSSEIALCIRMLAEKISNGESGILKTPKRSLLRLFLTQNTEAKVSIFRDGKFVDMFTKTYEDVRSGAESTPETVPGLDTPVDQPAQTEEKSRWQHKHGPKQHGLKREHNPATMRKAKSAVSLRR